MRIAPANENPGQNSRGVAGAGRSITYFPDFELECVAGVPQPMGVLFIMTQHVQPAVIITLMHSQQA
jgi:hypothetical protein